ncbi:HNH endonuclease [Halocynthiibacter styelae]|uniref:HNH endonuclease n=1 Tax=Halocynthiibacter styelae TaxID=2761955 RepID=A0A8J7ICJ9_9RHOB|nr:HNH endonuclease [Paenihalocynthiibacter styelae]MBI1493438.1 HNH endonuclease [Paenihalocynthiibacter styelae]
MTEAKDINLSISTLREAFTFDFDAGNAWWRIRPTSHFKNCDICKNWNARWAHKPAFTSDNGKGYRTTVFTFAGQRWRLQLHRVIYAAYNNSWPAKFVDHLDGDPTNNSIRNLREVDDAENARNCARSRSNTSGTTGVYWFKPRSCWTASITVNGDQISLGYFKDIKHAQIARQSAQKALGFSKRHGEAS